MLGVSERLRARRQPVRVGIIGIGSTGRGMALQAGLTPGLACVAIADVVLERATRWATRLGREFVVVDRLPAMHAAIRRGKLAVCADGLLVARCELLDVVIEATNSVAAGGAHAVAALAHHKHLVMMNYEADLMFGPYLLRAARRAGVVYSACDGDQPTVIRRLAVELEFMGFQVVMAGNIKGFLDRYATPDSIIAEADRRGLDYRMCASFTDGTKLAVEMAVVANALGARAAVPGMFGPRMAHVREAFDHFDFAALWRDRQPVVDYVLGARPKGGVFVVAYSDDPVQRDYLSWFPSELGPGPFYLFDRPYHLSHIESMATVAAAVLDGVAVLQPWRGFQTNVYAYAKRDLAIGTVLDGVGGFACYGLLENCADQAASPGLPVCLADHVTLTRPRRKDERILLADVSYDPQRADFVLFGQAVQAAARGHR